MAYEMKKWKKFLPAFSLRFYKNRIFFEFIFQFLQLKLKKINKKIIIVYNKKKIIS